MGAAVQALRAKQVNRLILTRPAVEAGERLGFLPGTLHEKIDPYLKPLWDALHDMMEADELRRPRRPRHHRGRPPGVHAWPGATGRPAVLTPEGWRPIGELVPGDLVVGSDGRPTPVLGTSRRASKDVYRLTAQDGASTRCTASTCGRHDAVGPPAGASPPACSRPAR
jgi:phosphate starvation-inducible protein PhoH and related proteins